MKDGPDIAMLGALIGDPARANMLLALLSGKALTASELAAEAGVTPQTASSHLSKLEGAGLVSVKQHGRHRYATLADEEVGGVLEAMLGLAAKRGHLRTRTGPRDPAMRKARVCYDHLAGELGVQMYDSLIARKFLSDADQVLDLTTQGRDFLAGFGVDPTVPRGSRRPLCKSCLDWSARRSHLAGAMGSAMLEQIIAKGWAERITGSRIIAFSAKGEAAFIKAFPV